MPDPKTVASVRTKVDAAAESYQFQWGVYEKAMVASGGKENRRVRQALEELHRREARWEDVRRELDDVTALMAKNVVNPSIQPGCWIETPHGVSVCTEVGRYWVYYRYHAIRCHDEAEIWVGNGAPWYDVELLEDPDVESRRILTLKGPYGLD